MFTVSQQVFLRLPCESDARILHPARVTEVQGEMMTVELEAPGIDVPPGCELVVFFEREREFMQQAAQAHAVLAPEGAASTNAVDAEDAEDAEVGASPDTPTSDSVTVGLAVLGAPVSAEHRTCYRVSTVLAGISTTLGAESDCPLQDVSATGFAVVARAGFNVGNTVDVSLEFDETEYTGAACVQSVRTLDDGRFRYGLHCLSDRNSSTLERGLAHISSAVQRRQMRRLKGTG